MFTTPAMALPASLLAGVLLLAFPRLASAADVRKDNGDECTCFRTNGSFHSYFVNHQFHDFRNVKDNGDNKVPTVISNQTGSTHAYATSPLFLDESWTNSWAIQSWNNSDSYETNSASVFMINSPNNVYIEKSADDNPDYSTFLTLRASRLPDFQGAAEIDSVEQDFQFLSARFMARVVGSPGACAGMFTYLANDDPQKVQEADIEILTKDPRNAVQYTNQPADDGNGNVVPEATANVTIPGGRDWSLWNVYRVDWTPKMTSWYVNGESVANISFQAPKDPTSLIVNMWSDGGGWTGNMTEFDEAYLQIQWMQYAYNTSGPYLGSDTRKRHVSGAEGMLQKRKGDKGCAVVCSIDEPGKVTGSPALLYNNTSSAPVGWNFRGMGSLAIFPLVLAGAAAFGF